MINEKRVRQMARLAIFESENARELQPSMEYARRDFVSKKRLEGFLIGTLLYVLGYAAILALLYIKVFNDIRPSDLIMILLAGFILYVIFLFRHLYRISKAAGKEYDRSAKKLQVLKGELETLENIYEEEEKEKSPEGDWKRE